MGWGRDGGREGGGGGAAVRGYAAVTCGLSAYDSWAQHEEGEMADTPSYFTNKAIHGYTDGTL